MSSTTLRSTPFTVLVAREVRWDRSKLTDLPVGEYVLEMTREEHPAGYSHPFLRVTLFKMEERPSGGSKYRRAWGMWENGGQEEGDLPAAEKLLTSIYKRILKG